MISPESLLVKDPDISSGQYFRYHHKVFYSCYENSTEREKRYFRLGPFTLEFIFPNGNLIPKLIPAFAHLETTDACQVDLSVAFWDSASTGEELSPPPWTHAQGGFISFHGEGYYHKYNSVSGCLYSFDSSQNRACYWIQDYRKVPYYETGAPILSILNWWLKETSFQLIHGGGLGLADGGILLIGRGGSGKSTTCASALRSNLFYAGDDYCLVDTGDSPKVYGILNSSKIRPDMLKHFDHLKPMLYNADRIKEEKPLFFLYPQLKNRLIREFPLKAILIPQVVGAEHSVIEPASAADTLRALAPSTIFQLSGLGKEILQKTTQLVQRLPCYFLKLGKNPQEVPGEIEKFLRDRQA